MATAQANAAERLDQLLVDGGAGPMAGEMAGGDSRFVFSASGHIGAIVNPSSNPKAGYRVGDEKLADAGQRMRTPAPGTYVFKS